MPASTHDRIDARHAEYIAALLTEQQHLFPHRTIRATIHHLACQCGLSKKLTEDTAQAIVGDAQRSVGRLSRAEILDFARRLAPAAPEPRTSALMVADHQDARAA